MTKLTPKRDFIVELELESAKPQNNIEIVFVRTNVGTGVSRTIRINTIPQQVNYSYTPQWVTQSTLGRQTPLYQYTGAQGKKFSFSLTLHEDVHTSSNQTLEDLVDDIKSLSIPDVDEFGNTQGYPRVQFFLGELGGFVKVETSITWGKPFRNGKYVMATVTFNIDVLEELGYIRVEAIKEKVGKQVDGELDFKETQGYVYTSDQYKQAKYTHIDAVYGVSLPNYVTEEYRLSGQSTPSEVWDVTKVRMKDLLPYYTSHQDSLGKDGLKSYNAIMNTWDEISAIDITSGTYNYTTLKNKINDIKENHRKFMDYYYTEVNLEMTRAEKERVIEGFNAIFDKLLESAGGILGYGATD